MEKRLKLYVLTDGTAVFLKKRMTSVECDEKNVKAREATDGNIWWAPARIDDVPPASRQEAVEKGLVFKGPASEASGPADRSQANLEGESPLKRAGRIFDRLVEEICYGLNFRLVVAELPDETLGLLERILDRIEKGRK